jgi:hypothetical protein
VYVKADGWEPRSTQVYVGNIEKLIHNLGGEMLYGTGSDSFGIVLRELIQNARDSIKARKVMDDNFDERINLSINKEMESTWLIIEDNGIGMSERVLTGPLLDFGTSFWTSTLVQSEFPGLRSSSFKSVGKFGIGFYSIFMLAEQVIVSSRNYDSGLADIRQLKFRNGFTLRPILSKGAPENFNSSMSTQIKIKLRQNTIPDDLQIEIKTNTTNSSNFKVPPENYLSALCAGLDVNVFYKIKTSSWIKIHNDIYSADFNNSKWLTDISFADFQQDAQNIKTYISNNISRIKPVIDNGKIFGIAAINTRIENNAQDFLSISTVGGLANSVHYRSGDRFIGFLDHNPKSAKREIGEYAAPAHAIKAWAENQLAELLRLPLNDLEKYIASSALCEFKVDPSELAKILTIQDTGSSFLTFPQLAKLSEEMGILFFESGLGAGGHMETYHNILKVPGYALIRPLKNSSFLSLKRTNGIPETNFSILDCLYRSILKTGRMPEISLLDNFALNSLGYQMRGIVIKSS